MAGLAYYFSGHDYLDIPGLDVSPRAFPELTVGAWVKVNPLKKIVAEVFCFVVSCYRCASVSAWAKVKSHHSFRD